MFDDDEGEEDEEDVGVCAAEAPEEVTDKSDLGEVRDVLRPPSAAGADVLGAPLSCAVVDIDMPESPVRTLRGIPEKPS